jgi:hypothetical protein
LGPFEPLECQADQLLVRQRLQVGPVGVPAVLDDHLVAQVVGALPLEPGPVVSGREQERGARRAADERLVAELLEGTRLVGEGTEALNQRGLVAGREGVRQTRHLPVADEQGAGGYHREELLCRIDRIDRVGVAFGPVDRPIAVRVEDPDVQLRSDQGEHEQILASRPQARHLRHNLHLQPVVR